MIHPEHTGTDTDTDTGTGTHTASQVQISNLRSQISNATRRALPSARGQNQGTEPRTKNQEKVVHPHPRTTPIPTPIPPPTPTPFPTPSNHTYQLSRNSLETLKNLETRNSKLETHAHLSVTILPAAWHVSMSAARAAQSGSSVPANVALSLMLQIYMCMCSIVFFSRAHWALGDSVSKGVSKGQ